MRNLAALFAVCISLFSLAYAAPDPEEALADLALEARARELSRELRCVVCQSQSINDSNAPLAKDLRLLVRERIAAGDDDAQVLSYVTDRYGEFVLLRPKASGVNLILWVSPFLLLLLGGAVAIWFIRQQQCQFAETVTLLSEEEQALLQEAMSAEAPRSKAKDEISEGE